MRQLAEFPVDDVTLAAVEHALGARYEVNDDGTHRLVGADYTLSQLLDFLSAYDPEQVVLLSGDVYEYVGGEVYSREDAIRALVAEVRRLRAAPLAPSIAAVARTLPQFFAVHMSTPDCWDEMREEYRETWRFYADNLFRHAAEYEGRAAP